MTTKTLTIRLPEEEHNALRTYAFLSEVSLNEAVLQAIRKYLVAVEGEQFEKALERFRTQYRVALDKLADL